MGVVALAEDRSDPAAQAETEDHLAAVALGATKFLQLQYHTV